MAFTADNLRRAIKACRSNIEIFEQAADKERESIVEYQRQIKYLQDQEDMKQEIYDHVQVVREDDSTH